MFAMSVETVPNSASSLLQVACDRNEELKKQVTMRLKELT